MISFCKGVEDREERNTVARAIISVMGQLFPYLRDIDDYKHKLWDHLHIMSNFELDVDSPYPVPQPETLNERPQMLGYPNRSYTYGHYGTWLEGMIKKAVDMEAGEEREVLTLRLANLMKKHYIAYNRSSVEDHVILKQLNELSGGKLKLKEGEELASIADLKKDIPQVGASVKNQVRKKGNMQKKRRKR